MCERRGMAEGKREDRGRRWAKPKEVQKSRNGESIDRRDD